MRTFCINCSTDTIYRVSERKGILFYYHKGREDEKQFHYTEQFAFCTRCGEEVYVPSVNDENCRRREQKLRLNDLIFDDVNIQIVVSEPVG